MKMIAVTQRVVTDSRTKERRDTLDQSWWEFLELCGLPPLIIPNHLSTAKTLIQRNALCGVLLTGGNHMVAYGGDAPERDEVEVYLLSQAKATNLPLLGVCRGMEMIMHDAGIKLEPVEGHVSAQQIIEIDGVRQRVNSYHTLGAMHTNAELCVWAQSEDGVVKAINSKDKPITGIMWHPERMSPFRKEDIQLFRSHFTK
jgi:gamma-glutamyl-gamma-aminobutyrate hydrolase PuuD